jgi:hypothetical protein
MTSASTSAKALSVLDSGRALVAGGIAESAGVSAEVFSVLDSG